MHDVRGFDRPLTRSTEKLLDIIPVDIDTFTKKDGKDILFPYKFSAT